MTTINETGYERNQRFNSLVSWPQSFRYRNIPEVFDKFAAGANREPVRVVEIGCAHAKLFALLNGRINIDYTGIEAKDDRAKAAAGRHRERPNFGSRTVTTRLPGIGRRRPPNGAGRARRIQQEY